MVSIRKKKAEPDPLARLREMVEQGKATYHPASGSGPLPVIKLKKPVPDLERIIREAKGE